MNKQRQRILRNFILEMAIYGLFLALYFWAVLRLLQRPLTELFHMHPATYAVAGLLLVVVQAVALEAITAWLIEHLGLERLE